MKKLLITLEYPPFKGGVAVYLENLVAQFNSEDVLILAKSEKNSYLHDSNSKVKIIRDKMLYSFIWPRWFKTYFLVKKIIKKEKIDHIIISHILPLGYIAYLLNIPYTIIAHGTDVLKAISKPHKSFLMKKILNKSENIIVNSFYTRGLLENEGIKKVILTAYPCPQEFKKSEYTPQEINNFKSNHNIPENSPIICGVGRLVTRKGFDVFIATIARLRLQNWDVFGFIVGSGPEKNNLIKLVKNLGLEKNIIFLENISSDDLGLVYASSDIFLSPSINDKLDDVEGFGTVFLEAAQFGLPAIGGAVGGVPEAILDQKTGILVDATNIEEVIKASENLLSNAELRLYLGQNAKKRANELFNWEKQFEVVKIALK